jgi:hypothetical protein
MAKLLDGYRLNVAGDKVDDDKRIARYKVVSTMAVTLPAYANDPGFKAVVDGYLAAGKSFSTDVDASKNAEAAASLARTARDGGRAILDNAYDACVASVWNHAVTIEDVKGAGFVVLQAEPVSTVIEMPTALLVKFDPVHSAIALHVMFATKGKRRQVYVEVSPDPVGPTTWKRLDTTGVKQRLLGFAPGTWWLRAAAFRAKTRSDWVGPVSVVVK